jgi:hypothetical protein
MEAGMLHIVWMVLKILGMILICMVGIVFLAALLGLLFPVSYQIEGRYDKGLAGSVRISWLFRAVSFGMTYDGCGIQVKFRVFGIPIRKREKKEKRKKKRRRTAVKRNDHKITKQGRPVKKKEQKGADQVPPVRQTDGGKKDVGPYARIRIQYQKGKKFLGQLRDPEKVKNWKKLLVEAVALLKLLLPKRLRLRLHYGCGDPAMTGRILAGFSMFYPLYAKTLHIQPDFEQKMLEAELKAKGNMQAIRVGFRLYRAYRIYRRISNNQ